MAAAGSRPKRGSGVERRGGSGERRGRRTKSRWRSLVFLSKRDREREREKGDSDGKRRQERTMEGIFVRPPLVLLWIYPYQVLFSSLFPNSAIPIPCPREGLLPDVKGTTVWASGLGLCRFSWNENRSLQEMLRSFCGHACSCPRNLEATKNGKWQNRAR